MTGSMLVGYDGRPPARDALALASRLADALGARLIAAFVSEAEHAYAPYDRKRQRGLRSHMKALRGEVRQACGTLAERGALEVVSAPAELAAIGLHDLARSWASDLLVVGSTHRGPAGRVLVGSTAERLLVEAPCAIAVAPRGFAEREPAPFESIGVGLDESQSAEAAFAAANELAQALEARLVVLSAEGHGARAEAMLEREADQLDLLVVGSRANAPVGHTIWGSVSRRLMKRTPAPLVVVPSDLPPREGRTRER